MGGKICITPRGGKGGGLPPEVSWKGGWFKKGLKKGRMGTCVVRVHQLARRISMEAVRNEIA